MDGITTNNGFLPKHDQRFGGGGYAFSLKVNKQDFLQVFQGSEIGKIEDNLTSADPLSYTTTIMIPGRLSERLLTCKNPLHSFPWSPGPQTLTDGQVSNPSLNSPSKTIEEGALPAECLGGGRRRVWKPLHRTLHGILAGDRSDLHVENVENIYEDKKELV